MAISQERKEKYNSIIILVLGLGCLVLICYGAYLEGKYNDLVEDYNNLSKSCIMINPGEDRLKGFIGPTQTEAEKRYLEQRDNADIQAEQGDKR